MAWSSLIFMELTPTHNFLFEFDEFFIQLVRYLLLLDLLNGGVNVEKKNGSIFVDCFDRWISGNQMEKKWLDKEEEIER